MRTLDRLKSSCPGVYARLRHMDVLLKVAHKCRMLRARLGDSGAKYWSQQGEDKIRKTWKTRYSSSSRYLSKALAGIQFGSLLELGSSCGNRLAVIAKGRPDARFVGIDINRLAVTCGNRWLFDEGLHNVTLDCGRIEDLSVYPDRSFDVVFSWAALMYVRPARIPDTLKGVLRVSAKAVVLIEMQTASSDENRTGVYYPPGNWKRDYVGLLEEAGAAPSRVECEWVDESIWSPGGGGGACIRYIRR